MTEPLTYEQLMLLKNVYPTSRECAEGKCFATFLERWAKEGDDD